MYCPNCRGEFRSGFERCERCGVDLVDSLSEIESENETGNGLEATDREPGVPSPVADYCGFLSLDEARRGRDLLREQGIATEITIREAPDAPPPEPIREEYWLRVEVARLKQAHALLGDDPGSLAEADAADGEDGTDGPGGTDDDEGFACGGCGEAVPADAAACPACGVRFDDD